MAIARTVYIIQSRSDPSQHYVGLTSNLYLRLAEHNAGMSRHTSKYRPWALRTAVAFDDYDRAARFERHLKSGSGRAFLARHFL
jgi:predicted GIY-YIG superfamily endonuclease